jgi:hypothetical protein
VKNIVPALAATNAVISAACAVEAFKIATSGSEYINNFMQYNGGEGALSLPTPYYGQSLCHPRCLHRTTYLSRCAVPGVYTYTYEFERVADCAVCKSRTLMLPVRADMKLSEVVNELVVRTHGAKPGSFLITRFYPCTLDPALCILTVVSVTVVTAWHTDHRMDECSLRVQACALRTGRDFSRRGLSRRLQRHVCVVSTAGGNKLPCVIRTPNFK